MSDDIMSCREHGFFHAIELRDPTYLFEDGFGAEREDGEING